MKKIQNIRYILFAILFITVIYAAYGMYYKITKWGFEFGHNQDIPVWTIEGNISFIPTGEDIKVSFATPSFGENFKILAEDVVAKGYEIERKNNRLIMTSSQKVKKQKIFYKVLLFDNKKTKGKTKEKTPPIPQKPFYDEQQQASVAEIIELSKSIGGDRVQQIIRILTQLPLDPTVAAFLPQRKTQKIMCDIIGDVLSYEGIANRSVKGLVLKENRKINSPDYMIEAYIDGQWKIYDLATGNKGLPENFIIFQKGENSLLDVEGGYNSSVKFSVLRSNQSSFALAGKRAELSDYENNFKYSMYSLPLLQQNTLKWFTIFPLSILLVTLIRNVVGLHTMGTFTPMLLSMAFIKTGFISGFICFLLLIGLGFLLRTIMSKFNLLLVPRISAVVIFIILIMQMFTIVGYRMNFDIISSALFFPIIITAWIVERSSITLEEEGVKDCITELVNTLFVSVIIYFVISSENIRNIMFAFNELNFVILAIIMLLGTYTGYRFTELARFASLIRKK